MGGSDVLGRIGAALTGCCPFGYTIATIEPPARWGGSSWDLMQRCLTNPSAFIGVPPTGKFAFRYV